MIGRNGLDENALDEKALDENWAHGLTQTKIQFAEQFDDC